MEHTAGIIAYRIRNHKLEVMLSHAGGPFHQEREWGIQKGKIEDGETDMEAARREFQEETGFKVYAQLQKLGTFKVAKGKTIVVYFIKQNFDAALATSNMFDLEWPPNSGNIKSYPEMDCAKWMTLREARKKIFFGQIIILDKLEAIVLKREEKRKQQTLVS